MKPIQIVLLLVILLAFARVVQRFRQRRMRPLDFCFWTAVWLFGAVVVLWPEAASGLARVVGIGRGADLVLYVSVIALFYLVFRVYVRMEYFQHDLTKLTRHLALQDLAPRSSTRRPEEPKGEPPAWGGDSSKK